MLHKNPWQETVIERLAGMDAHLSKSLNLEQSRGGADNPGAPSPLDPAALDTIRRLQQPGTPSLLNRVIAAYLDSAGGLVERIGSALAAGDAAALREAAHALKSSSGNIGATTVVDISRILEAAARSGDLRETRALGETLLREYARAAKALEAARERTAP